MTVLAELPVCATPPWGCTGQPAFLTMALEGETSLRPRADLAPELRHPVLGRPVRGLLAGLDTTGVKLYG
jgi:7,8-dihydro-6-hydroxymethylpterin-pyrophosphokinase